MPHAQVAEDRCKKAEAEVRELDMRSKELEEQVQARLSLAEAREAAQATASAHLASLKAAMAEAEARVAASEDAALRLEAEAAELAHAVRAAEDAARMSHDKAQDARLQTNALAARLAPSITPVRPISPFPPNGLACPTSSPPNGISVSSLRSSTDSRSSPPMIASLGTVRACPPKFPTGYLEDAQTPAAWGFQREQ